MKTIKFVFQISLLAFLQFFLSCKKEKVTTVEETVVTPTPDPFTYSSDLQSSKDISFANYTLSDIEMICSFMGEGVLSNSFYSPASGTSQTVTAIRDEAARSCFMAFNNTSCADGKKRSGTINMAWGPPPGAPPPMQGQGPMFMRDPGYEGRVSFSNYYVGDWKVELYNTQYPLIIRNQLSNLDYNPSTTNITWRVSGKLKLVNGTDTLIWDGSLTKTLENTSDVNVFASDKKSTIKWSKAKITYADTVWGERSSPHLYFKYGIDKSNPIKRDFTCAPVSGSQFHPFLNGKAIFYIGLYHPRTIDYGPEGNCDNTGKISFKDESHDVEFDRW